MSDTIITSYDRTDLACERRRADVDAEGVRFSKDEQKGFEIERLLVESNVGADAIGMPTGEYVTVHFGKIGELDTIRTEELSEVISELLLEISNGKISKNGCLLIAGLGNRSITADAIGPETVDKIIATRHLRRHEPEIFKSMRCQSIAAIAPGVLGQTGIEASDMVRAAVDTCHADMVIAIDALAARSTARLASTIQICDSGITPGSGIGNARTAISSDTVGVPVIAIGVPTVVNSSTLIYDAIKRGRIDIKENLDVILRQEANFFVSPRESDMVTEEISRLIADAVNLSFGAYSS